MNPSPQDSHKELKQKNILLIIVGFLAITNILTLSYFYITKLQVEYTPQGI